ncbi:MAG: hypothetical protein AB1861_16865 [Cyanobacteriota bacterium]
MRHYLFIDDSRIEGLGISSLGGLLIPGDEYARIQGLFRDIKVDMYGDAMAPVKWSPPGVDDVVFAKQRSRSLDAIRHEVSRLLGQVNGAFIFCLIDEQGRRVNRASRIRFTKNALEFLCQRTQMEMCSRSIEPCVSVVLEMPGGGDEGQISRYYNQIRSEGSIYPNFSIALTVLDHTLFLTHDYMCEGIQLIDMAVGATCFAVKGRGTQFFEYFKDKVRRGPGDRGVKGYGIVVYPSNATIADSLCSTC